MDVLDDLQSDALLEQYEITGKYMLATKEAAHGGLVGAIVIENDVERGPLMRFSIGEHNVFRSLPTTEEQALALIAEFRAQHVISADRGFERVLMHLMLKASKLYRDENLERLALGSIHLLPSGYLIGKARLTRADSFAIN